MRPCTTLFLAYHLGITAVKMAADDFDFGLETDGGLAAKVRKYYGVESTADAPSRVVSQAGISRIFDILLSPPPPSSKLT